MAPLPTGTVTFLFTDLEGSTRLWEEQPDAMREALTAHDAIVRGAIEAHGGLVVSEMGDGMAAAFTSATEAVHAAVEAQIGLGARSWDATGPLRARMGLHLGEGQLRTDGQYVNQPLNRCARLMAIAHGGQVVISEAVESVVREALAEVTLVDLGEQRLRDLTQPLRVFQVVHPELVQEFPPLRSLNALPGNLPRQLTTFVGRDDEMTSLADLVREAPLVTLTGVGGVGKTRLALQVAADLVPDFPDGAWLCDFAPITDPGAVWETLAASLRVHAYTGRSLEESVLDYLTAKRLLVVLDNCEHLIDPIARVAGVIAQRCPHVSLLATSREGLAVAGERMVAVRPLGVPVDDTDAAISSGADAVQLFSDRASAAKDDFVLSERNAAAVGVLCRRLDGIPLAIELAAARVRSLSPEDLASRLDQRFKLLTGGSRAALERHQTLRSTIDWSYDLLGSTEQQALNRLSVFAGGCDLRAAEVVLSGHDLDVWDIADTLGHLVDKSLVIADGDHAGKVRYRLLETIRQYARERLEATGDTARVRRRHADHYVEVAEVAGPHLRSPDQLPWAAALARDIDNFRVALDWTIETGSPEQACRMVAPFAVHGLPVAYSAMEWALTAATIPGVEDDPRFPAVAAWAAWGAIMANDLDRAGAVVAAADRTLRGPAPIPLLRARTFIAYFTGDFDQAAGLAEVWATQARASADRYELGDALALLGWAWNQSAPATAVEFFDEAMQVARAGGVPSSIAMTLSGCAGSLPLEEADRALELLDEAIEVGTEVGDHMAVDLARLNKGMIAARRGDWRTALRLAADTARQQLDVGDLSGLPGSLGLAASAFSMVSRHEVAAVLLGRAGSMSPMNAFVGFGMAAETEMVRDALGDEELAKLEERGATQDLRTVVDYLCSEAELLLGGT